MELPRSDRPLFLPQKPYLPLGTLRDVLVYPFGVPGVSDARLRQVLHLVGMEALADKLEDARLWSHVLSLGEQQRLAFARVLLQKPQWVFLDEASSALDEPAEDALYHTLVEELPETAIISVGHRSSLLQHHQHCLRLQGGGRWHLETIVHPVPGGQQPAPA